MAINSNVSLSVTVSGAFDLDDLIRELQSIGRHYGQKQQGRLSVYKASPNDQRDMDSVTFSFTPKEISNTVNTGFIDPRGLNA